MEKNTAAFFKTSPNFDRFAMVQNILATLRRARIFQDISQQNIADFLQITQSSYAKIERGESKLSVDVMLKLCQYLSITPGFLFDEGLQKNLDGSGVGTKLTAEISGLIRELDRIDAKPDNRRRDGK